MRSVLLRIPVPQWLQGWGLPESLPIFAYGLAVLISMLLTMVWATRRARRHHVGAQVVQDLCLWTLVSGILGARLMHRLLYAEYYSGLMDFFNLPSGGLVLYGALFTTPPAIWWICRKNGLSLDLAARIFAPLLPLSIGLGRLGCFMNGCCYGRSCEAPWGVSFPNDALYPGYASFPVHPSQLYAFGMGAALCALLLWWERRRPQWSGFAHGLLFVGSYGIIRLVEEHFRDDTPLHFASALTAGQALSLLLIAAVVILSALLKWRRSS